MIKNKDNIYNTVKKIKVEKIIVTGEKRMTIETEEITEITEIIEIIEIIKAAEKMSEMKETKGKEDKTEIDLMKEKGVQESLKEDMMMKMIDCCCT